MNKANHIETGNDDSLVNTRPLFSSTWLALFSVLRQHYHERHFTGQTRSESLQSKPEKRQGLKN